MRRVLAQCRNCGKREIRNKGKSGIPCFEGGIYCGVMWVVRDE